MARINLLPWREQLREKRKQQFIVTLVGMLLLGAALVYLADQVFNSLIEQQNSRNAYIQTHIRTLDERIKEINDLKRKRQELIDRTRIIQDLQGNRPTVSRVFDQMVRTLPEGVYFTAMKMTGKHISVEGAAETNNLISSLMRRQDASDWLTGPNLAEVKAMEGSVDDQASRFKLTVQQTQPAEAAGQGASQ